MKHVFMGTPKVSIIVPVYNAGSYFSKLLDSLTGQTLKEIEIILVLDCPTDGSDRVAEEYAARDGRIVLVRNRENLHVGFSRNEGLKIARGEYIGFCDHDDWVEPEMLEELYKKAKEEDADMVICDFYYERQGKLVIETQKPSSLEHDMVLSELFYRLHGSSWNKLIRRKFYEKSGVKYPLELFYCEDLFVNACLLANDIRVDYLPKAFYHYDVSINENSLIRRPSDVIFRQEQILYRLLKEKLPVSYFQLIEFKMLPMLAYKALCIGDPYLKTFKSDYSSLGLHINRLEVPLKLKFLLVTAFQLSPSFVNAILRLKHCFK